MKVTSMKLMPSAYLRIIFVVFAAACCNGETPKMSCPTFCDGWNTTVTVAFNNSTLSNCFFPVTKIECFFQAPNAAAALICTQKYPACDTPSDTCGCNVESDDSYRYNFLFPTEKDVHTGGNFTCEIDCIDFSGQPVAPVDNSECVTIQVHAVHHFGIFGWEIAVIVVVTIVVFALLIFVQYVYIAYRRGLWPFGEGKKPRCTWWQGVLVFLALLLGSLMVISIFIDSYGEVWLFGVTGNCLRKEKDAVDVPKGLLIFLFVFGILCIVAWAIYMIVAAILKKWPFD